MFVLNDDLSIYITRGDTAFFMVMASEPDGADHTFKAGDVLRLKVYGKKDAENVVLQKDFPVEGDTTQVHISLTEADTKFGEVISKPTDYWYEVELNPYTSPQTIIGYDEDGAKVFRLFPEGKDIPDFEPDPEDLRIIDTELDMTSTRPVQNQAIARAIVSLEAAYKTTENEVEEIASEIKSNTSALEQQIAVERARIDNLTSLDGGSTTGDAELQDIRVGFDSTSYSTAGNAVRGQIKNIANSTLPFANYVLYDNPFTDKEAHIKQDVESGAYTVYIPALLIASGSNIDNVPAKELVFSPVENAGLYLVCYNFLASQYEIKYWRDFFALVSRSSYVVVGTIGMNDMYIHIMAENQKYNRYLPFVSVITGHTINGVTASLPVIDTVKRTLTFPTDTLLRFDVGYYPYVTLTETNGNTVCDFSGLGTSAVNIVFDTVTRKMYPISYADKNLVIDGKTVSVFYPRFYLVCTVRTSNKVCSCTFPYICDGYFMGTVPQSLVENWKESIYLYSGQDAHVVKSINHRGYNIEAPENTLSAFKLSKRKGFKFVECDVSFTSDGVPVLLHDSTVDRTSNGTGKINEMTFEEVRSLDFGSWFSEGYAGEKIPSFEEFISLCRNLGLHPYIEVKASDGYYTNEQIDQLLGIVKRYGMTGNVTWISFSSAYLSYIREVDTKARLGYLTTEITDIVVSYVSTLKNDSNDVFINAYSYTLTNAQIEKCIDANIPLEVWLVNDVASANALNPYITGMTSDNMVAAFNLTESNI